MAFANGQGHQPGIGNRFLERRLESFGNGRIDFHPGLFPVALFRPPLQACCHAVGTGQDSLHCKDQIAQTMGIFDRDPVVNIQIHNQEASGKA